MPTCRYESVLLYGSNVAVDDNSILNCCVSACSRVQLYWADCV